jgi:hypothetical protein
MALLSETPGGDFWYSRMARAACRRGIAPFVSPLPGLLLAVCGPAGVAAAEPAQDKANYFNDPFLQATDGIPDCPVPAGPEITRSEMLAESHSRVERGTSCFQAGRCRLPNAYLYDAEIVPRARKAIAAAGTFGDTSVWLLGQRRWVWLKGCVRTPEQSAALERLVRSLDDVEAVINELAVRAK